MFSVSPQPFLSCTTKCEHNFKSGLASETDTALRGGDAFVQIVKMDGTLTNVKNLNRSERVPGKDNVSGTLAASVSSGLSSWTEAGHAWHTQKQRSSQGTETSHPKGRHLLRNSQVDVFNLN